MLTRLTPRYNATYENLRAWGRTEMGDDAVSRKLAASEWTWGDKDPVALDELEKRIAREGRKKGLITYSDLVKDVAFRLPNVRNGAPYTIRVYDWSGLDRAIIGSFLGYISSRSYRKAGFMASALVVNSGERKPSRHFFNFMHALDILNNKSEDAVLAFWSDQVEKAHRYYRLGRR
jgi:hypothetical protein